MNRVLFVDDEPNLLEGLRRMLRGMRGEWDMIFAVSGVEALEILGRGQVDVLVTDMRMPGLDGGELLGIVRQQFPDVVRVVLTGHADKEMVIKSLGPAHQYLSKPCDAESLKSTLAGAFSLRQLLCDKDLVKTVSAIESLPSLPSLYTELVKALNAPDVSMSMIGEMISKDVGVCAKLLQLVNSAYFGLPTRVSNPQKAVSLLGLELVKSLVLTVSIFSYYDHPGSMGHAVETLWNHGLQTGMFSRCMAARSGVGKDRTDDAFVAGLLHDVGKLILMETMPDRYLEAARLAEREHCSSCEAERSILGTTHGPIGAYLLGIWGLPDSIVHAAAYHHAPSSCPTPGFSDLTLVHIADVLVSEGRALKAPVAQLDMLYLKECGVAEKLETWRLDCAAAGGDGNGR
ncbi:MAG: HDOD domain-containing protein [Desulfobacteraceae bacterium]|nr:HDOD domain-containing protein [Desulfobacteraceae bacterium]